VTIIDMHAHIAHHELFPAHFLLGMKDTLRRRAVAEHGVDIPQSLLDRLASRWLSDADCTRLLREMDAAGIATTVLLIADFGFGHADSEVTLEVLYQHYHRVLRANPDRFVVFGGTDPRRGRWALELFERGLRDLGFGGLKLYPPCGYEIDDPGLSPYYELCEAHGVPVLVHTGPSLATLSGGGGYPETMLRTAARFPRVRFVLGHAAFQSYETNLAIASRHRNVYLETSGFQRILDQEAQVKAHLRALFEQVPEQVVFGTDWPVFNINNTQKQWVDYFAGLGVLDDENRARFFYRNAEVALGRAGSRPPAAAPPA
jgi:predicted TIM-barrel fold metal-dependent hydrolase